ncbi:hypothetical protein EGI94_03775 [Stutzerimonas stutzeri]|nr:hypothetical protein EGI94_03775 [Stutzerimonas stutzeri]
MYARYLPACTCKQMANSNIHQISALLYEHAPLSTLMYDAAQLLAKNLRLGTIDGLLRAFTVGGLITARQLTPYSRGDQVLRFYSRRSDQRIEPPVISRHFGGVG